METASSSLADYAVRDDRSAGRMHREADDPSASPFARDRRRILQTTAFRRLQYKTQVFVADEHDHFRTRLTHTLEVVEIARRLAVALRVNQTLAETIALAHDLGHPPFGHAGESALNDLMADHGGFEHNAHSLRVVDYLEHPFPPFRGLNLSFEVREGLAKHETVYDKRARADPGNSALADLLAAGPFPSIEGQIACLADRLAYDCHDLEDAVGAGLIDESDLASIDLWHTAAAPVRRQHPGANLHAVRRPILNTLADLLLRDAVEATRRRTAAAGATSVHDVRHAATPLLAQSPTMEPKLARLDAFLRARVYRHERLADMDRQARDIVTDVFNAYVRDPAALPPRFAVRVADAGPHRVVCDYVAGMTDRFCRQEHERLTKQSPPNPPRTAPRP